MAKREWIGEYWLIAQEYKTYKNEWVEVSVNLGRCLGNDDACDKAVTALIREFPTSQLRDVYVLDGWGHLIYM
jgi:hypothetical protein